MTSETGLVLGGGFVLGTIVGATIALIVVLPATAHVPKIAALATFATGVLGGMLGEFAHRAVDERWAWSAATTSSHDRFAEFGSPIVILIGPSYLLWHAVSQGSPAIEYLLMLMTTQFAVFAGLLFVGPLFVLGGIAGLVAVEFSRPRST